MDAAAKTVTVLAAAKAAEDDIKSAAHRNVNDATNIKRLNLFILTASHRLFDCFYILDAKKLPRADASFNTPPLFMLGGWTNRQATARICRSDKLQRRRYALISIFLRDHYKTKLQFLQRCCI
jgi:hypothetical protein